MLGHNPLISKRVSSGRHLSLPKFLQDFFEEIERSVKTSIKDRKRRHQEIKRLKEIWAFRMEEILEAAQDKDKIKERIGNLSIRQSAHLFLAEVGIYMKMPRVQQEDEGVKFCRRIACWIMHQILPFIGQPVSFDLVSSIPWRIPKDLWPRDETGHYRKFTEEEIKLIQNSLLELYDFIAFAAQRKRDQLQETPQHSSGGCPQSKSYESKKSLVSCFPKRESLKDIRNYAKLILEASTAASLDPMSSRQKCKVTAEEELEGLRALLAAIRTNFFPRCSGKLVVVLARDGLILTELEMYLRELGGSNFSVCSVYQPGSPFTYGQNQRTECLTVKALRLIGESLFARSLSEEHAIRKFKNDFTELIKSSGADSVDSQLETTQLQKLKELFLGTELEKLSDEQLKNLLKEIKDHCKRLANRVKRALVDHESREKTNARSANQGERSEVVIFDTYGTGKTALLIAAIIESELDVKTSVVLAQQKVGAYSSSTSSTKNPFVLDCLIEEIERRFPDFDWPFEYVGGLFYGSSKLPPLLRTVARSIELFNKSLDQVRNV